MGGTTRLKIVMEKLKNCSYAKYGSENFSFDCGIFFLVDF